MNWSAISMWKSWELRFNAASRFSDPSDAFNGLAENRRPSPA
jgi:hypothetical protein